MWHKEYAQKQLRTFIWREALSFLPEIPSFLGRNNDKYPRTVFRANTDYFSPTNIFSLQACKFDVLVVFGHTAWEICLPSASNLSFILKSRGNVIHSILTFQDLEKKIYGGTTLEKYHVYVTWRILTNRKQAKLFYGLFYALFILQPTKGVGKSCPSQPPPPPTVPYTPSLFKKHIF